MAATTAPSAGASEMPFTPENLASERVGPVGVNELQCHLTLLQWFKGLEQGDTAMDFRQLLLAEVRYTQWLQLLVSWQGPPEYLPLPPIDVAYLWHAHMLTPVKYAWDMYRLTGDTRLLAFSLPLHGYNDTYGQTQEHGLLKSGAEYWIQATGLPYHLDPTVEPDCKVACPWCRHKYSCSWDTMIELRTQRSPKATLKCPACDALWNRDTVSGQIFWRDVLWHLEDPDHRFLRGTQYSPVQWSELQSAIEKDHTILFDGLTAATVNERISSWKSCQWHNILREFNEVRYRAKRRRRLRGIRSTTIPNMIRAYREVNGPCSLDLGLAVLRQRSFTQSITSITWSDSESLGIAIQRYKMFMGLMKGKRCRVLVPTLDVDLAWHTHQLFPKQYARYTIFSTGQHINHDDTYSKSRLNTQFALTAKLWLKKYKTPYTASPPKATVWDHLKVTLAAISGLSDSPMARRLSARQQLVPSKKDLKRSGEANDGGGDGGEQPQSGAVGDQ
ncbi:hypothetical protein H4R34_000466 [Dimargaris verticillata]|uniref:Uncharacterized protein n=1 Tax=Dimargaris verticillata TaxID=2761393 RepID=A0A9W8BAD8_9FUNG|nr:hypothetical protein H4R34_000466 [Dimargaris verticillata]